MRTKNDGKELERKVAEALRVHQEKNRSVFHRFADTTSAAGNLVQAQPGDFLWLHYFGPAVLVECKSTATGESILDLVKASKSSRRQIPCHRLWHIAGHKSIYIWGNLTTREVCVYEGKSVIEAYKNNNTAPLLRLGNGCMESMYTTLSGITL